MFCFFPEARNIFFTKRVRHWNLRESENICCGCGRCKNKDYKIFFLLLNAQKIIHESFFFTFILKRFSVGTLRIKKKKSIKFSLNLINFPTKKALKSSKYLWPHSRSISELVRRRKFFFANLLSYFDSRIGNYKFWIKHFCFVSNFWRF